MDGLEARAHSLKPQDLRTSCPMHALLIFARRARRPAHPRLADSRRSPFFDVLLGDAHGYDEWARRLAAGDWIGTEVFYQAPLYPYFLGVVYAIFGRDLLIVRIVQAADRLGVVRAARPCRRAAVLEARRPDRRPGARALRAGDLLRRPAAEVRARHVLRLPGALADRADRRAGDRRPAVVDRRSGWPMGGLALTRENALVLHRGDRRRAIVVRARTVVRRTDSERLRTVRNPGAVRRRPGDRAAAGRRAQLRGRWRLLPDDVAVRIELLHRQQPATPTAPTRRSASAAARRSSSGRTRRKWPKRRSAAR